MSTPPSLDPKMVFGVRVEVDAVLPGSSSGFTPVTNHYKLIVGHTDLQFIPKLCGIACGKAFVIPLLKVVTNKMVRIPYAEPGMMMKMEEEGHVPLIIKVWVTDKPVESCYNQIEAMRKLTRGEVLVAGTLDPVKKPSGSTLSYFSRDATRKIYDAQSRLVHATMKPDGPELSEKILLGDGGEQGTITLTRKAFGVEMHMDKSVAGGGTQLCSVFCQPVPTNGLFLHYTEVPGPNSTPLYKLVIPGGTSGTISNLKVEVPSSVILTSPYENMSNEIVDDIRPVRKSVVKATMSSMGAAAGKIRRSVSITRAPTTSVTTAKA
mmetsp:Transcript_14490/g.30633  ORF Transcript_14490/g.30633 Transcript_14490/m.30633 type:complete len:321 (+) Transcript_14490:32-994(+)